MPKLIQATPKYCRHKASGQATVSIDGVDHYLGPYGTLGSRTEYDRLIALWLANGRRMPSDNPAPPSLSVAALILEYWKFADVYYRDAAGPTREVDNIRDSLNPLLELYGPTPGANFSPKCLKIVRQAMINDNLARKTVNGRVGRIKRMFKWAVSEDLIPPSVFHGLLSVSGLRQGRSGVREGRRVLPVSEAHVLATLPQLSPPVRAMVELQLATGARPGEVLQMRKRDIDQSEELWVYRPPTHKTVSYGHERAILLGPRAQVLLKPFLEKLSDALLFSPVDGVAAKNAAKRASRKTPMTPSQAARKPKANPRRRPRLGYTRQSYYRAIERACKRAGVPHWHPHQLRHTVATNVRKAFGIETARVVLGHNSPRVTEVYAERDLERASEAIRQLG